MNQNLVKSISQFCTHTILNSKNMIRPHCIENICKFIQWRHMRRNRICPTLYLILIINLWFLTIWLAISETAANIFPARFLNCLSLPCTLRTSLLMYICGGGLALQGLARTVADQCTEPRRCGKMDLLVSRLTLIGNDVRQWHMLNVSNAMKKVEDGKKTMLPDL